MVIPAFVNRLPQLRIRNWGSDWDIEYMILSDEFI